MIGRWHLCRQKVFAQVQWADCFCSEGLTMQQDISFGDIAWTRDDLLKGLEEFAALYAQRPIQDNQGGMKAPHMAYTWFVLKHLRPKVVIESGVWRGQSTWLIEQTCPDAELHCIDPDLSRLIYRSPKATY